MTSLSKKPSILHTILFIHNNLHSGNQADGSSSSSETNGVAADASANGILGVGHGGGGKLGVVRWGEGADPAIGAGEKGAH